jgi:predicted transcriptional regulator YdeE
VPKCVSHVLNQMKESVIKAEVYAIFQRRKPAKTIPKLRMTLFQWKENDVAIVEGDLKANYNNNVAEKMSR